jgi:hypothetical protein
MKNYINKIIGLMITSIMLIIVEYINIIQWNERSVDIILTIIAWGVCGVSIYYFITLVIMGKK